MELIVSICPVMSLGLKNALQRAKRLSHTGQIEAISTEAKTKPWI